MDKVNVNFGAGVVQWKQFWATFTKKSDSGPQADKKQLKRSLKLTERQANKTIVNNVRPKPHLKSNVTQRIA